MLKAYNMTPQVWHFIREEFIVSFTHGHKAFMHKTVSSDRTKMIEKEETVGEARTGVAALGLWSPSENLSPRIKSQRDYYFLDEKREFQNEVLCFTTGIDNDYIENIAFPPMLPEILGLGGFEGLAQYDMALLAQASKLDLPDDFWDHPLIVRRAMVFQAVLKQIPVDILPDELIVGGKFSTGMSAGFNKKELEEFYKLKDKIVKKALHYLEIGLSSTGMVQGHVIPDHVTVTKKGLKGIKEEAESRLKETTSPEKKSFYKAIMICCDAARDFAHRYAEEARRLAEKEKDPKRKEELTKIAENCDWVPWNPARTFWEALQSYWFQHMLYMIAENYPGPGTSYPRLDVNLYPYYKNDIEEGRITKKFAKELFQSFCIKHNYAYDYMPAGLGRHGRHAGDGQLFCIGGCGSDGKDMTNDLTHMMLDAFVELNMLEPKLNVRTHAGTPKEFMMKLADITRKTQGSPFITNFDKTVIEALERDGVTHEEAVNYSPIGCMENTIRGSEAGTVDVHFNHVKPLELVFTRGKDFFTKEQTTRDTGDPAEFKNFDEVTEAYKKQLVMTTDLIIDIQSEYSVLRGTYLPCPYASIFIKGCIESGNDVKDGGGYYCPTTINGVGIATIADALAAIKNVVFDDKKATMKELVEACFTDFKGKEELRKMLLAAPKFGNDDDYVDLTAREVMTFWANYVNTNHWTPNHRKFRAGYLSWNHYIHYGTRTMATPDGKKMGEPLSNGVGPHQGRDLRGPTAAIKSVGKLNLVLVPSGGHYTWTINPATMKTDEQMEKYVALMRVYNQLGGTAWQTNCITADTLRDAQERPENYANLLVRVTGYNAYFVTIGRSLQNEIIARTEHEVGR